jgi:hypothetical protein
MGRNSGHSTKPFINEPCEGSCIKLHCLDKKHFKMSPKEKERTENIINESFKNIYKKHQGLSIKF